MFQATKIKLTAWYLLIIMAVSISFSAVMYTGVVGITKRALDSQKIRLERRLSDFENMRFPPPPQRNVVFIDDGTLIEVRERTLGILFVINTFILIVSAILGYFLAGKTLNPIEDMVNKQNRFISDAAHELKTPLTAMKTNLEVTLRDKDNGPNTMRGAITSTVEEIDKMNLFVTNLLKKSKSKIGTPADHEKTCDFAKIVTSVIKTLNPLAQAKNIQLKTNLQDSPVAAPQADLIEIAMNLIDNAIKYSGTDSTVFIYLTTTRNNVCLKVTDEGQGIPQAELNNIFEPFYKVDTSRSKKSGNGFGLGLSIVKDLISANKGTISVESTVNKGSTFTVIFPKTTGTAQLSLSEEI